MRRAVICLLSLSWALCSCEDNKPVKYSDLNFTEEINLYGELLNDSFLFNSPQDIFICDSMLVIYDNNTQEIIHIFSRNGLYKKSAVKRGRGPGEILTASSVDIIDNKILVCDPNLKRLVLYDLDNIINDSISHHIKEYILTDSPHWVSQAKWYNNDHIVVKGNGVEMRYGIWEENKVIPTYSDYCLSALDAEENRAIWDYFAQWKIKPDNSKMVTTTYVGAMIEILSCDDITNVHSEKLLSLHKPVYNLAEGAKPKWITPSDDTTMGFEDLHVTDNYIYALIYGVNINDMEATFPSIYVLSWDGKPVLKYMFSERIMAFGVDDTDSVIYAVVTNGKNVFLKKYQIHTQI